MEYKNTLTTCIYCGSGCSMYIETIDGQITGVWPAKTNQISEGRLCIKGWNVTGFVNDPDRLKMPLIRRRVISLSRPAGTSRWRSSPISWAPSRPKAGRIALACLRQPSAPTKKTT